MAFATKYIANVAIVAKKKLVATIDKNLNHVMPMTVQRRASAMAVPENTEIPVST